MLFQMFERGRGKGAGPVQYTTLETVPAFDENGRRIKGQMQTRIPPPEVLRGDPEMVERLIDSSPNQWKYSSGVVAFGNTDAPTEEEQQEVMNDFERTFFAGLEPDQYSCLWVRHTHEGNVELHFVIPRLELSSSKALNPFPPGYMQMSDAWRDKWNHAKGWERPDDPSRMRLVKRPNHEEKISATISQAKDPRGEITDWLVSRIESGKIENRADLVASLKEIGEVTRAGKDYVSVKPEGSTKTIRLKGAIYGEDFERERFIRAIEAEDGRGLKPATRVDLERAREAAERLKEHVQRRSKYNVERYPRESEIPFGGYGAADGPGSPDRREDGRTAPGEAEQHHAQPLLPGGGGDQVSERPSSREPRPANGQSEQGYSSSGASSEGIPSQMDNRSHSGPERLSDYLRRELGPAALPIWPGSTESGNDRPTKPDDQALARPNDGLTNHRGTEWDVFDTPSRRPKWLQRWRQACNQITNQLREGYERIRASINASIERIEHAIQDGYDSARRAEQASFHAGEQLVPAGAGLEQSAEPVRAFLAQLGGGHGGFGVDEISQALKRRLTDSEPSGVTEGSAPVKGVEARTAPSLARGFGAEPHRWRRPKG